MQSPDRIADSQRHLLLVEDDPEVVNVLRRSFEAHGFGTSVAGEGMSMRAAIGGDGIDLVLLKLGLPGEDGLELTRYLRTHWRGPIIIVTGRGEAVDRIVGLELGADDYVTKPFELRELLARVRSVLRRTESRDVHASPDEASAVRCFEFEGFRLDLSAHALFDPGGAPVPITSGELELLLALVRQPNVVLSRDRLMSVVHGREAGPFDRAIDVQIGRLRRRIEKDSACPVLIKSVRGAGYLFAARVRRV